MRSKFLVTFLACFLLSFSFVTGQEITLDNLHGTMYNGSADSMLAGESYVFDIRFNNSTDLVMNGITNGYKVYSPDGATWTNTVIDTTGTINKTNFDLIFTSAAFSVTGSDADTVGWGGALAFGGIGLPAGFNDVAFTISVGPISDVTGTTICLDSASYPSGTWKWQPKGLPAEYPSWDGPHCYTVVGEIIETFPPVLAPIGPQNGAENSLLEFGVSATDDDGDPITLSTSTLPTGAGFTDNGDGTGTFSWTPDFTQEGNYDITFTASDGALTDDEIVTISIANTNRAPIWVSANDDVEVNENEAIQFSVGAIDLDGETVTLSVGTLPPGATFDLNMIMVDEFNWTPSFDQAGIYEIIFTATDGDLSIVDTVVITVNDVNRTPVLDAIGAQSTDEGVLLNFAVTASDPDGTIPTLSVLNLPDGASFLGGSFDWTPTFLQAGNYDVTFIADDGEFSDSELVTITVVDVPQTPVLDPIGPKAITAGEVLTFFISSTDADGTFPTLGATPLPGTAQLVDSGNGNGYFEWATTLGDSGSYDVTFSATDGVLTDEEIVTITVGEAPKLLVVSDSMFTFNFVDGESATDTAFVTITELNGSNISVDVSEASTWMDLSGFSVPSLTPADLKIAVYPNGLPIGTYMDSVVITSPGAINTQVVYITMNITERPNTVAYIVSPTDSIFFTDECTPLDIHFVTGDDEEDPVTIGMNGLVENMTFLDNGDGTADFNFTPSFVQAGFYPLDVVLFDGRDSAIYPISIVVDSCEPGTEGDTVTVATTPAVPGARLTVPVDFANLCTLTGFDLSFGWNSPAITLDSISFIGSRLEITTGFAINNDSQFVSFYDVDDGSTQPDGSGNFVNLHFSLDVDIPAGFYPINFFNEPSYLRDCGGGVEDVRPFFIPGGIVVDTSGNYVCGYVVDPGGNPIPGATVELWDNFPSGSAQDMQDASGNGVFSFADFTTIPFDLYAYHPGYYPNRVANINFATSGIMIILSPISEVATPTNVWVDFFCGVNTFKDSPLPVGSVIEAYDPDGVKCGEFIVTTAGEYGFLHCYGDDEFTPEDEGAVTGDVIRFFINGLEATTGVPAIWTNGIDHAIVEVCLDLPDVTPHSCMLTEGWNLVSWNVDTDVDDIANVLNSIDDCVEVVLGFEQGALTYDASLPQFSDLWMVDHLSAYWIKVSCDVELTVLGTPVPSTTPIPVTTGWNLVSYLPDFTLATEVALSSIQNDLVVSLGYDGSSGLTYLPGQPEFNDLTSMSSCYGYWVKVTNDGNLIYPENGADSAPSIGKTQYVQASSSAGLIEGSTSWMNIYAYDLRLDDVQVKAGAKIKAYSTEDQLVGSYVMKEDGKFGFMPIYGDDNQTAQVDGMKSGDEFYLTVDDIKTAETFTWTTSGDKMEIKGVNSKEIEGALPNSFSLSQNYPNPFNPSTTIEFSIPVNGNAKVEIFNMLGQHIATPFNEVAEAGQHIITWDGRNQDGKSVASGIYFYRLTADNFTNTKKMTLLK